MPNTVDEDNAVEKERKLRVIRERAQVFRDVFGPAGSPTKHGGIILEALQAKFGHVLPPNVLDNHGRTDPYQTWRRLGHFDVLEYITQQITWKETTHEHPSRSSPQ
jgi:hypothetical protein